MPEPLKGGSLWTNPGPEIGPKIFEKEIHMIHDVCWGTLDQSQPPPPPPTWHPPHLSLVQLPHLPLAPLLTLLMARLPSTSTPEHNTSGLCVRPLPCPCHVGTLSMALSLTCHVRATPMHCACSTTCTVPGVAAAVASHNIRVYCAQHEGTTCCPGA